MKKVAEILILQTFKGSLKDINFNFNSMILKKQGKVDKFFKN